MPKRVHRAVAQSNRLARRANQVDPRRLELLEQLFKESLLLASNEGIEQQSPRQALDHHAKLFEILEELRRVESSYNPKLPERNDHSWNEFFKWINTELEADTKTDILHFVGVSRQSTTCKSNNADDQEYSLIAKAPFKKGENVFGIPRKVFLSTETASEDADLLEFASKDYIASSMQNVLLVLHLLNEYSKGPNSYWHSYLAILPSKLLPVFTLTKGNLSCLLASSHIFEILKMIRAIARQYSYYFKCLQSTNLPISRDLTFEYYAWGVSVVCTRQNEMPIINGPSRTAINALIPILDMCNHDRLSNQAVFEDDTSKLFAVKDLNVNDEITLNYGNRSSGDFYIHNGFVPEEVPFDIVPLNIALIKNEPLYESRVKLLKTLNMPTIGRFRLTHNDYENRHKRDPHLTMFLIVHFLSKDELELILSSDNPVGIADEIYEFVQYNDRDNNSQKKPGETGENNRSGISVMKVRIYRCIKEYLSKRAAIGIAMIERSLSGSDASDIHMLTMLKHEKSIYQSHLINHNDN